MTPIIGTGFNYTEAEAAVMGTHGAVDLEMPRGTELIAPFDGYYMTTYGEYPVIGADDKQVTLTYDQALAINPHGKDIRPPANDREQAWPIYIGGYLIQGWDPVTRFYIQIGHVDSVSQSVVYHPPKAGFADTLEYSNVLRARPWLYKRVSAWRNKGDYLGTSGMTGCGWGIRCWHYGDAPGANERPDFTNADYPHYTTPHVHLAVFGPRAPFTRNPRMFDPFGMYTTADAGYPSLDDDWSRTLPGARHHSLWKPQS